MRLVVFAGALALTAAATFACSSTTPATYGLIDAGKSSSSGSSGSSSSSTSGGTSTSSSTGSTASTAEHGLYAASCLTELASGQISKVFTFYTTTEFSPSANGGQLAITLQALALVNQKPPTTFAAAGTVGAPLQVIEGTTDATGSFRIALGAGVTIAFPGAANPVSGSDVVLSNAGLAGKFATDHWCARLTGHVDQPVAASRTLDETKNFCLFIATAEGAPVPAHVFADYSVANCPL